MNLYWFSFSLGGVNQGICIVEDVNPQLAHIQVGIRQLHPHSDDVQCFQMSKLDEGLEINRLYTREEMVALGYISVKEER